VFSERADKRRARGGVIHRVAVVVCVGKIFRAFNVRYQRANA